MALKMLLVCLASWLILANSATVAPKGDGGEEPPPPPSELILQHEIQFEGKFPLQEQLSDDFTGLDLPFLDHGDPNSQTSAPFSPRGIRPSCHGGLLCTRQLPRFTLDEFPPARPTLSNIGNICAEGRKKSSYGRWNLPQTSFSHLSRQGDALNNLEEGFSQCCRLPGNEKLSCSNMVWEKALTQYCKQEFSVKDRHHHCCIAETSGADYGCFARQAPFPMFDKEISLVSLAEITPALLDSLCGQFTLLTKQRRIPALVQNITELCCKMQGSERTQCAEEACKQSKELKA